MTGRAYTILINAKIYLGGHLFSVLFGNPGSTTSSTWE